MVSISGDSFVRIHTINCYFLFDIFGYLQMEEKRYIGYCLTDSTEKEVYSALDVYEYTKIP